MNEDSFLHNLWVGQRRVLVHTSFSKKGIKKAVENFYPDLNDPLSTIEFVDETDAVLRITEKTYPNLVVIGSLIGHEQIQHEGLIEKVKKISPDTATLLYCPRELFLLVDYQSTKSTDLVMSPRGGIFHLSGEETHVALAYVIMQASTLPNKLKANRRALAVLKMLVDFIC